MPIPVPNRWQPDVLARYQVNEPASAMHFRSMIQKANFLTGYALQSYFSGCYPEPSTNYAATNAQTYNFLFIPTPGVQVARVQLETYNHTTGNQFKITNVWIDGVGVTPLTGSDTVFSNTNAQQTATTERLRQSHKMYLDISSYSSTSVHTLTIDVTYTNESKGISHVSFCEVPLSMIDPNGSPSTEAGANEAWPDNRNRLFEGSATTGAGTQRLIRQATNARKRSRLHWQIATPEDDSRCIKQTASVGFAQLEYLDCFGTDYDPYFFIRAKRRSSTSVNNCKVYIRYKWAGAAGSALFRATIESSEDNWANIISTDTTGTINLANTAGGYVIASDPCTLFLDGAGQRNRVSFGAISDTHDLYITNIALIEEET